MKALTDINISDFKYDLPLERIAGNPLANRDQSKLLVYKDGEIYHKSFDNITEELPENNLVIRNNTRVIQARLIFKKETGAKIEIFCLEPSMPADYERNFAETKSVEWHCLIGNAKKWKAGSLKLNIKGAGKIITLTANKLDNYNKEAKVRFEWDNNDFSFADILDLVGSTPIPPYLNRKAEERDKRWYQTVYAQTNGSVAAPTAGLHFTEKVFNSFAKKNINIEELTLHVGAGTFRPVQSEKVSDHEMHTETILVQKDVLSSLVSHINSGITAIGTTSLRTLESLYWLGRQIALEKQNLTAGLIVDQWEPYEGGEDISPIKSLESIIEYLNSNNQDEIKFATKLIIVPGYKFRIVNRLITNFHQPGSTLLLLVAAFIGEDWRRVYQYALENDFRFLSYGDSSILEKKY